jgi:hypothetical protein
MGFFNGKEFVNANKGRCEKAGLLPMFEFQIIIREILFGRDLRDEDIFIPRIHQNHGGTTFARLKIGIREWKNQHFPEPEGWHKLWEIVDGVFFGIAFHKGFILPSADFTILFVNRW